MDNQMTMLVDAIEYIKATENIDNQKAFNKLLQWCGLQLGVTGALFKAKGETHSYLSKNLNLDILKDECRDWFGELYCKLGLYNEKLVLIDYSSASKMADDIISDEQVAPIQIYLDSKSGTGRTLASLYNKTCGKCLLYGVEKDKILYRISLVNFALHGIKAKLVQWNETLEMNKLSPSNPIWDRANGWNS